MSSADEKIHRHVLNSVAGMIPDLALDITPPEIATRVYNVVYEITGNQDPYFEEKNRANEAALSLYSRMKDTVDYSGNPLQTACQLAIAGNDIDLGAHFEYGSIDSIIEDSLGYQLDPEDIAEFRKGVEQAGSILYIGDNAGETVFDRVLIEKLLQIHDSKIIYVVREKPIINDATYDDAIKAGLDKAATIISSGSGAPATILSQCSPEMLRYYRSADVIISKGQGNYESLSGQPENIFFLFKVKCPVIARNSGHAVGSDVLIHSSTR
jgi:uncharacterized protein with ATP-grasp and redox domains